MSFRSRLLRWNRTLSWILVGVAITMVMTGYGVTRSFGPRLSPLWFVLRDIHVWVCLLFTLQIFLHTFVVELFIRSRWFSLLRGRGKTGLPPFLLFKLGQKLTGYLLFILAQIIVLTGLNFHLPILSPFFPLLQHVRVEIYLIITIILHSAIGMRMVLLRKKKTNRYTDMLLLVGTICALAAVFYLDSTI